MPSAPPLNGRSRGSDRHLSPSSTGGAVRLASRRLTLQLWLASMLCWWVIGIPFSRLWWLVNEQQLRWILFCYAWQVPAIGWTGAVLLPYLLLRRLRRRLDQADPGLAADLSRYPGQVAFLVLATSTVGYLLGAIQIDILADLPPLEFVKIALQGPVFGGLFAVAAYFLAERAVESFGVPRPSEPSADPVVSQPLYGKIFSITIALTVSVAVPVLLHGLTQWQRLREETRGRALLRSLEGVARPWNLDRALSHQFGPHTYGFAVRRSDDRIIWGAGRGQVLDRAGQRDFQPVGRQGAGWFASRDGQHKVVAFQYRPGVLDGGEGAVFVAVSPLADYGGELRAAAWRAAEVAGVALVLALILAAMLARSIVRPIERLRRAAAQMAAGNLEPEPAALVRGDEIAALGSAFDRMAVQVRADERALRLAYEQLQHAQARLVQHERLSAVGRVVSGVAHELNNPLSAVLNLAEDLLADGADPAKPRSAADREAIELIAEQTRRCRAVVHDLLAFTRARYGRPEPTTLERLLAGVRDAAGSGLAAAGAALELDVAPGAPVLPVDRSGLELALTHLVVNGAQAAGRDGTVRARGRPHGGGWEVVVEDSGPGIAPDDLPRIFEPFYTTRAEGEGTGLGLAVSLGIVERHGGTLQAEDRGEGRGARFIVRIPAEIPARPGSLMPAGPADSAAGDGAVRPRVLIVDDEHSVRVALARFFRRTGWDVDQAGDGEEALRLLEQPHALSYQVVITDLRMPRRTGLEVHDWLATHRTELFARLIIATGDVASPAIREFLSRTSRPVLEKPFELSVLADLVEQVRASA